jgi:microsomal dipeptidase-like Zn-dependent dipeptidase
MNVLDEKYTKLGEAKGFLGKPVSDEMNTSDGAGLYRHFEGGSIYWSPQTGAFEVHGAIREKWDSLGGEGGLLGYPITDETVTIDGVGHFNHFQQGSIYWAPKTGVYEVHGDIREHWAQLGWERGELGYPTSDETKTPDSSDVFNQFQYGEIRWSPKTGAQETITGKPDSIVFFNPKGVDINPDISKFITGNNWGFEAGFLYPWYTSRRIDNAFVDQPIQGARRRVAGTRRAHITGTGELGGDYWQGGYWTEQDAVENVNANHIGEYWISTDDHKTGVLTSKVFTIATEKYISFLLGGGGDVGGCCVELWVKNDENLWILHRQTIVSTNDETMRRQRWNVQDAQGRRAKIIIRDESSSGHINVDDFRFEPGIEDLIERFIPNVTVSDLLAALAREETLARLYPAPRPGGGASGGSSQDSQPEPEPEPEPVQPTPVWGFADIHTHPMSHRGFGGQLFWGAPTGNLQTALSSCEAVHPAHDSAIPAGLAEFFNPFSAWETGYSGALKNVLINVIEGRDHAEGGSPDFAGWPHFMTRTHQQMHVDWIKRAWQGGLRLMVALAVNSELLAHITPKAGVPLDDKSICDDQIAAMKSMAEENRTWMGIAYSPEDARQIIGEGKLAVILGIEVDTLGNWGRENDCTDRQVSQEFERLFGLGVRHIFPVHLADNAFSGCSLYNDFFEFNQHVLRDQFHNVSAPSDNRPGFQVHFRLFSGLPEATSLIWPLLTGILRAKFPPTPQNPYSGFLRLPGNDVSPGLNLNALGLINDTLSTKTWLDLALPLGHVNTRGLTGRGQFAIQNLMNRGMIIDIDHMSERAANETLNLAEACTVNGLQGYPVVSSHTTFRELKKGRGEMGNPSREDAHKYPHESDKSPDQVERIRALGGMVGVQTIPSDVHDYSGTLSTRVPNDCPGSSKSWAQMYLYAVEKMGGKGIGIGTDFNGLAGDLGPRFGTEAVYGLVEDEAQNEHGNYRRTLAFGQPRGVKYEHPIMDYRWPRFKKARTDIPLLGTPDEIYTQRQRDFLEALAAWRSGVVNPDNDSSFFQPGEPERSWVQRDIIKNYVKGLRATSLNQLVEPDPSGVNNTGNEQRAAFLVSHGIPLTSEGDGIRDIVRDIGPVWQLWQEMENVSSPTPSLQRCVVGVRNNNFSAQRDFDFNLDGLAHYGMLPDFMQDLKNIGLTNDDLAPLFRSAEDYIQMWEKCWRMRMALPPGGG